MRVIWRDIRGYEGKYQVSNLGNVRSLNYKNTKRISLLKPNKVGKGYRRFGLCKDGVYTYHYAHQLVWETFVGEIPEGLEIDHIIPVSDGGGDELTNLRLVTRKGNMHNESTYKKYFVPCSESKKESIRKTSKGKHYSPSTEFKNGEISRFKNKHHTEEAKKKISKKHNKEVHQYTLEGILVNTYRSCKEAAEKNGFSLCGISSCATNRIPHYKKFIWRYTRLGV